MGGIVLELNKLREEVSSLKEELSVMKGNVRELNEQLYNSYKRIKVLYRLAK